MTPAEFEGVVARVRYKPNWNFRVQRIANFITLEVVFNSIDVRSLDRTGEERPRIFIARSWSLSPTDLDFMLVEDARRFIVSKIAWMEQHETDEWLRFDGTRWQEPQDHGKDDTV